MRDILDELVGWWSAGRAAVVATVVATTGSAPRPVATAMLVGPDGSVAGSVSGGCVEADVHATAGEVMATGVPVRRRYGITGDDAFAVGLACGGTLDVYLERVDREAFPQLGAVADAVRGGAGVAVVTEVEGPATPGRRLVVWPDRTEGSVGAPTPDAAVAAVAREWLAAGRSGILPGDGRAVLFVSSLAPRPRMLIFGAVDIAVPLSRLGALLGYDVTLCDARPAFATARRFPDAAEVVVDWPHRYLAAQATAGRIDDRTVVCVLTHDAKFDDPLLLAALAMPLRYVGALGSRRTQRERAARLRAAGLGERDLARLRGPIGLDLGGVTPEETAVSVAAEIIAVGRGGSGAPLGATAGSIHPASPEREPRESTRPR